MYLNETIGSSYLQAFISSFICIVRVGGPGRGISYFLSKNQYQIHRASGIHNLTWLNVRGQQEFRSYESQFEKFDLFASPDAPPSQSRQSPYTSAGKFPKNISRMALSSLPGADGCITEVSVDPSPRAGIEFRSRATQIDLPYTPRRGGRQIL